MIFNIITNLVSDGNQKNEEAVETFKEQFGERAIKIAFNVLQKNQFRVVKDSGEESEKTVLSLSVLNFLKYCSRDQSQQQC